MNPIIQIWNLVFYLPLFHILFFLYEHLRDFGLAIISLTLLIKFFLLPITHQSFKNQAKLSKIQSKISEIEKKFKEDSQQKAKALISLYNSEKINPLGSLIIFLQLPILIALYRVFLEGAQKITTEPTFLGVIHLSTPNLVLAFLASLFQFSFSKLTISSQESPKNTSHPFFVTFQNQTSYLFPTLTFFILFKLPAAMSLYWMIFNFFSIIEYYFFYAREK